MVNQVCNPIFLDSVSGFDWTVIPVLIWTVVFLFSFCLGCVLKVSSHLFFDISFLIDSAFILMKEHRGTPFIYLHFMK